MLDCRDEFSQTRASVDGREPTREAEPQLFHRAFGRVRVSGHRRGRFLCVRGEARYPRRNQGRRDPRRCGSSRWGYVPGVNPAPIVRRPRARAASRARAARRQAPAGMDTERREREPMADAQSKRRRWQASHSRRGRVAAPEQVVSMAPTPNPGATGYYVEGRNLYDRCGEQVILRGVSHPTIYVDRPGDALPEIAKTGANVVRIFWYAGNGIPITAAEPAIARAIANGMIPMLEMHDSTCEWNLDPIVAYYTSSDALALIDKYKANLLINIANEPSPPSDAEFASKYTSVVNQMRSAGIHTPLVIDGGNCGRDYNVLFSQGPAVLAADPDHNLIFSGHLYDPLSQAQITQVFEKSVSLDLPFIVGGVHLNKNRRDARPAALPQYDFLIQEASRNSGSGWLAWSWGDNDPSTYWNTDCSEFDMTETFASTLQRLGKGRRHGQRRQHQRTRPC